MSGVGPRACPTVLWDSASPDTKQGLDQRDEVELIRKYFTGGELNMKKFLALVLALVMTMSLVTISAGAEDFTDADSINYADAVEVMTAIGVVGGYADGSFNPTAGLTRGAAAKIICNMILGPTTAEALSANDAPYSDVAVDNVFAGYIAYCANEGIISGYADGTFRPAAPLTGYAFMKMLLGALGYDAAIEGYTGSNWSIQVAKRALNIGLDAGLEGDFVGAKALTREEACLYAFNTLKADMVRYNQKSTISVGDLVISQNSEAVTYADKNASKIWVEKDVATLQFAEKYFGKLSVKGDAVDSFGRPAATWYYDKDAVGTYAVDADLIYVNEYDADIQKDLVKDKYVLDKAVVWYNGAKGELVLSDLIADEDAINGYTIELFDTDDDKTFDTIVVIEEYFAQVGKFTAANAKKDKPAEVQIKVIEQKSTQTLTVVDDEDSDTDAYDMIAAYEKDDYVSVVVKPQWEKNEKKGADYILTVNPVEAVEGKITKVDFNKYTCTSTVKMDGVVYELNNECVGVKNVVAAGHEGTLYLDAQGCVIGWVSDSTATAAANLVYVTKIFDATDKYGTKSYFAQVVHADGEIEEIEVVAGTDAKVVEDTVCSYDYAKAGDTEYTLSVVKDSAKVVAITEKTEIKATAAKVEGVYFADDVNFVYVNKTGAKLAVSVAEGVQKVTSTPAASYAVLNTDGDVVTVFVRTAASAAVNADDLAFIADNTADGSALDADGKRQNTYDFYVNGEKMTEIVELNGLGFMTYAVDGETYKFEAVAAADGAVSDVVLAVAKDKYVTVTGVCTDATVTGGIYDLTDSDIETLADIAELIAAKKDVKAYFMYDEDNNVITSMYVTSVAAAKQ
jgi:hypothetical protein